MDRRALEETMGNDILDCALTIVAFWVFGNKMRGIATSLCAFKLHHGQGSLAELSTASFA